MCHTAKQFLLSTQIISEPITCTDLLPLQVFTITFGILQTTTTLEAYANKSEILYRVDNIALKLLRQTCNLRGLMWNQRQQGKGSKREVHGLTFFYFLEREEVGIFHKMHKKETLHWIKVQVASITWNICCLPQDLHWQSGMPGLSWGSWQLLAEGWCGCLHFLTDQSAI